MMKTNTVLVIAVLFLVVGLSSAFANGEPEEIWDLPQTGQRTSYHTEDDGALEKGVVWDDNTRFAYISTEVLIDNVTGLMWARATNSTTRTWAQAIDYANGKSYAGFDDWRLPNLREMRSLVHYGHTKPDAAGWLNSVGFSGLSDVGYWTSTTYYAATGSAWCVDLRYGGADHNSKSSYCRALLVR